MNVHVSIKSAEFWFKASEFRIGNVLDFVKTSRKVVLSHILFISALF